MRPPPDASLLLSAAEDELRAAVREPDARLARMMVENALGLRRRAMTLGTRNAPKAAEAEAGDLGLRT